MGYSDGAPFCVEELHGGPARVDPGTDDGMCLQPSRFLGGQLEVGCIKHGRVVDEAVRNRSVLEQSEQMILNPFKGYEERERNVLDSAMRETVKEFSTIDGAFIVRGNGVIETAGARLKAGLSAGLPSGLGARHAAAAGITISTKSIAITVSQSDGTVRVWRAGKLLPDFEPSRH